MNATRSAPWLRARHRLAFHVVCVLPLCVGGAPAGEPPSGTGSEPLAIEKIPDTEPIAGNPSSTLRPLPAARPESNVSPVRFTDPILEQFSAAKANDFGRWETAPIPEEIPSGTLDEGVDREDAVFPIDLPTALRLAGANNLQIALARERVNQAMARALAARALWIPSLNAGVVYNNHSGRLQATDGQVLEVSRSSLFVGGSAVLGNSPATGGAGIPRMFVDLSLADAIFEPLAARQLVRATGADHTTTFNDTLVDVSAAYLGLVRAQSRIAIAAEAVRNADELAKITTDFAQAGQGLQADADRAAVEAASRQRDALGAREDVAVVSAHLARLLRLDPSVQLQAADQIPALLEFVDTSSPLPSLIGQAIAARPEVSSADARRAAECYRQRQEQYRPWIPHLYAGVSGGGFGGGEGADVVNFGSRADFDVAAVWEVQNLGIGNVARVRDRRSAYRQASLTLLQIRDLIAAEVVQSYRRVQLRQRQIDVTRPQVESASQAMRLNLEGIRGGELRPIEIQQAIGALASARTQYLDAVTDYNIAQLQLLRAVGRPPQMKHANRP